MTKALFRASVPFTLLLTAAPTVASGYLPMPELRETLRSYRTCFSRLQSAAGADRQLVARRKDKGMAASSDGTTHDVSLEVQSKGVERIGRDHARYAARIRYRNGVTRPDLNQIEYNHSWESHSYECRGRVLITNTAQGYTLSTFEPLAKTPPQ